MMKKLFLPTLLGLTMIVVYGCSETPKSPDVSDTSRKSLDQAGLNDVSVSQDRDKGVVTLTGTVASDSDKSRAESIAKAIAGNQVVPTKSQSGLQVRKTLRRRWTRTLIPQLKRISTPCSFARNSIKT